MSRQAPRSGPVPDWGDDESGCSIMHVDMDAFYASVELARRPHLRGLPVIVGGEQRSVVLAATYEARAFGVHSAMPMATARQLCPQAVVVPPDHTTYREVSADVMALFTEVTPIVEKLSIDEAFLDVSGARRRLGRPSVIGAALRERVRSRHGITCSVGVASTKFVAKLASAHAKPDGMLIVPRGAAVDFVQSLPIRALWGVGDRTQVALARWGITTVAELAASDVDTVQRAVGRVAGAHLYDLAWGRDSRPVTPSRTEKSIGAETTFDVDTDDRSVLQRKLLELADLCASRMRAAGVLGRTVSIKVRTADFRTVSRAHTLLTPTDVGREVYAVARELLAALTLTQPVRLIGVRVEGLSPLGGTPVQPTLEDAVDGASEQRRQAENAVDEVRDRFGAGMVRPAALLGADSTTA